MTVREVKALAPEAEVYTLRWDCKYLIMIQSVASAGAASLLRKALLEQGITNSVIIAGVDIKILELELDSGKERAVGPPADRSNAG